MTFVGIDLAWKDNNRTGLAAVDEAGRLISSSVAKSDDEIMAWLSNHAADPAVVAVDAPVVVPNASGQRVAERLIGQAYGRYGASAHSASRSNPLFDPPRAWRPAQALGWTVNPDAVVGAGTPVCIEVYPHPALVGLFELPERVLYKKGADRRSGFLQLLGLLESVPVLTLAEHPRWRELVATVADPRPGDLTRIEDEIDAILCAHLAWLWHNRRDALQVYGSLDEGYIVAPPPPSHAARLGPAMPRRPRKAAEVEVVEVWGVRPGTTATAGGVAWGEAIRRETRDRAVLAPGARLELTVEFVVPARVTHNDEWDLGNLLKPTMDALSAVLGVRQVRSSAVQADDGRIDRIVASKRSATPDDQLGARMELRVLD